MSWISIDRPVENLVSLFLVIYWNSHILTIFFLFDLLFASQYLRKLFALIASFTLSHSLFCASLLPFLFGLIWFRFRYNFNDMLCLCAFIFFSSSCFLHSAEEFNTKTEIEMRNKNELHSIFICYLFDCVNEWEKMPRFAVETGFLTVFYFSFTALTILFLFLFLFLLLYAIDDCRHTIYTMLPPFF